MSSRHEAVFAWLMQCPYIEDIFVNFGTTEPGTTSFATQDGLISYFIDGSSKRNYDFSIIRYESLNDTVPNNDRNADILASVEQISDWVKLQNKNHNMPEFPAGMTPMRVEVLQETPTVAGSDDRTAKYMFSCRVIYKKESEMK